MYTKKREKIALNFDSSFILFYSLFPFLYVLPEKFYLVLALLRDTFKLLKKYRITHEYYSGEGYSYTKSILVEFNLLQVGIIHAINKLQSDLPNLNLAVSLHAPVQNIRCQIMPAARAFPLAKLMDALRTYQKNR